MADAGIDTMPTIRAKQEEEEEDNRPPLPEEGSSWKVYLKPYWLSLLLNNTKIIYGFTITFYYLLQFVGCVATVNLYSDVDRLTPCATTGTLANPEEASKVFDTPLLILAIWHIIEWIRTTVLLTVVCIGVNWTIFWYVTMPNSIFGLVAYAIVHMVYFSDDGKACKEVQTNRALWLLAEIIGFWVVFFFFVFPFIWTLCLGKDRNQKKLVEAYENDEDDD